MLDTEKSVYTPLGNIYAVKNANAMQICLEKEDGTSVVLAEASYANDSKNIEVAVYEEPSNSNSKPNVFLVDLDKRESEEVVIDYILHTTFISKGSIIAETRELFENGKDAKRAFRSAVMDEEMYSSYFDGTVDAIVKSEDTFFLAYPKGKYKEQRTVIYIEPFPRLVRREI